MSCYVQRKKKSQRLYQWCHHDTLTTHCRTLNRNISRNNLIVAMTVLLHMYVFELNVYLDLQSNLLRLGSICRINAARHYSAVIPLFFSEPRRLECTLLCSTDSDNVSSRRLIHCRFVTRRLL